MRGFLLLLSLVPAVALAAPAADVVLVWAPGQRVTPIEAVARDAGAVAIDRSPAPATRDDIRPLLREGIDAYAALRLDDAWSALERAREAADRTGAAGLASSELSDLFLYRALVRTQRGDPTVAWDELVVALVVDQTRVLDPARFPPKVVDELERARTLVAARPRASLAVDAPAGCSITVDGAPTSDTPRAVGPHWVRVTCTDRAPRGMRVDVVAPETKVSIQPPPLAVIDDNDILVQARAAGWRSWIVAEVHGGTATARLVGLDGRERDRRTVAISGDLAPLADAVRSLLHPRETPRPWYRRSWVIATGAAAIVAAIAIPLTIALVHDNRASTLDIDFHLP
ncbi:MAG TPA: hypothetical protein VGO00_06775 [Kofleriaceae bacterium]|nr:hypothetical protein [Kofleriaceae bacterium]